MATFRGGSEDAWRTPRAAAKEIHPKSMRRIFHKIVFRLRQTAWIARARLRTLYWKILGMKVGARTLLPPINVTWPHQVSIGARCIIEHDIHFKFDGPWKPGPSIVVGDGTFIGTGCEFNCHTGIVIGKLSMIAAGCRFVDTDHGFADRSLPMMHQHTTRSPIRIEDDVWLGANVVVLKGITIGRGAIVGAGAVVTKSIPEFEIWGGVPAKRIGVRPNGLPAQHP